VESVLASFASGVDGSRPIGGVTEGGDENFYGTTSQGGTNSVGTVFKITPAGTESILWSFGSGTDGQFPMAGLTQATDGTFYGTTSGGGANSAGTVFKITPAGSEMVLWSFGSGTDGNEPEAALIQGSDGNLYGTTRLGGTNGDGTVFKLSLSGVEAVLWNFGSTGDGGAPVAALIQGTDGNFYGTTIGGGVHGGGTVFSVTPSGTETVLWSFNTLTDGGFVSGGVIQAKDGNLYGATSNGASLYNSGALFRLTPSGAETSLWRIGYGGNGAGSITFGLIPGSDDNFYGVTSTYTTTGTGGGSVFKLTP
jgi:uncharacterized repeat protein (TIGR03803 family)